MPVQKNQTARARIDALERENAALKKTIDKIRRDPPGAEEFLDELDDQLGDGPSEPITLDGIRQGHFTTEELADRLPEVVGLFSGQQGRRTALTLDAIERGEFSTEELADRMDEVNKLMEGGNR